jgi:hypothetical protein
VTTDVVGEHVLEFWSVDGAGNVESAQTTAFTIKDAAYQALLEPYLPSPILSGDPPSGQGVAYAGLDGLVPSAGGILAVAIRRSPLSV